MPLQVEVTQRAVPRGIWPARREERRWRVHGRHWPRRPHGAAPRGAQWQASEDYNWPAMLQPSLETVAICTLSERAGLPKSSV
jgi:hypothetical protein